jgi:hypothetical protein
VIRRIALLGAVLAFATAGPVSAEPAHTPPQGPAHLGFGKAFPHLVDHEWGFALGGFGGIAPNAPRKHAPVIFVHGNNVDAADWYVVRDDFRAAGWSDQELFGLSYNGLGGNNGTAVERLQPERDAEHTAMGWDGNTRITNNTVNVADLFDFIRAVQAYTGSQRFTLVTHSLGVTLARKVLKDHAELRRDVVAFVGIAGGNHGTSLCPPGSEDNLVSCNEVAAGTPWLAELNGPDGADETYGSTKWLTVFDGSGAADPAYAGPSYADSPELRNAQNTTYPGRYHNDLRVDADIVHDYRLFVESADAAAAAVPVDAAAPSSTTTTVPTGRARAGALPATGASPPLTLAAALVCAALLIRRTRALSEPVARPLPSGRGSRARRAAPPARRG